MWKLTLIVTYAEHNFRILRKKLNPPTIHEKDIHHG